MMVKSVWFKIKMSIQKIQTNISLIRKLIQLYFFHSFTNRKTRLIKLKVFIRYFKKTSVLYGWVRYRSPLFQQQRRVRVRIFPKVRMKKIGSVLFIIIISSRIIKPRTPLKLRCWLICIRKSKNWWRSRQG